MIKFVLKYRLLKGGEGKMKELFEEVKVEVICFDQNVDVITESGDQELPPVTFPGD